MLFEEVKNGNASESSFRSSTKGRAISAQSPRNGRLILSEYRTISGRQGPDLRNALIFCPQSLKPHSPTSQPPVRREGSLGVQPKILGRRRTRPSEEPCCRHATSSALLNPSSVLSSLHCTSAGPNRHRDLPEPRFLLGTATAAGAPQISIQWVRDHRRVGQGRGGNVAILQPTPVLSRSRRRRLRQPLPDRCQAWLRHHLDDVAWP